MSNEKLNEFDLGPTHSTLIGGGPALITPDLCIVCEGPSNGGAQLLDSMTGNIEKYCWECHNMTLRVRKQEQER